MSRFSVKASGIVGRQRAGSNGFGVIGLKNRIIAKYQDLRYYCRFLLSIAQYYG